MIIECKLKYKLPRHHKKTVYHKTMLKLRALFVYLIPNYSPYIWRTFRGFVIYGKNSMRAATQICKKDVEIQ